MRPHLDQFDPTQYSNAAQAQREYQKFAKKWAQYQQELAEWKEAQKSAETAHFGEDSHASLGDGLPSHLLSALCSASRLSSTVDSCVASLLELLESDGGWLTPLEGSPRPADLLELRRICIPRIAAMYMQICTESEQHHRWSAHTDADRVKRKRKLPSIQTAHFLPLCLFHFSSAVSLSPRCLPRLSIVCTRASPALSCVRCCSSCEWRGSSRSYPSENRLRTASVTQKASACSKRRCRHEPTLSCVSRPIFCKQQQCAFQTLASFFETID